MDLLLKLKDPIKIKNAVQDIGYKLWRDNNKRGTQELATGVGKTRVALRAVHEELISNKDALIYIVVPTETLRDDDWPAEMDAAGYSYMKDHPNIVRICYASLHNEFPERDVDLIILDEVHHLTIPNSVFFTRDWTVFSIMGLTATLPKRDTNESDRDKRILIDGLCPSVFIVPLEAAIELSLISDFEIYVMRFDLNNSNRYIDVGKNRPKVTEAAHYKTLSKAVGRAMYSGNDAFKFAAIQKRVAFLTNLQTKTILAREIMGHILKNNRTLIFCGSIDQSKDLCGDKIYNSLTDDSQLKLFQEEKIDYLGVVDALNEGKNVRNLDNALIVKFTSQDRAIKQRIGRVVRFRPGHVGKIIILVAKNTAEEKWIKKALADFDKSRIKEHYVIPETDRAKATS